MDRRMDDPLMGRWRDGLVDGWKEGWREDGWREG